MMRPIAPRAFGRFQNRVTVYLHADQWTNDIPLPPSTRIEYVGEHREIPIYSNVTFVLEPDQTREILSGYFVVPLTLEDALEWFQQQLNQLGWERDGEQGFRKENRALIAFRHPSTSNQLEISLQWWAHRNQCTARIRYEVRYLYKEINREKLIQDSVEFEPEPEALNS